MGNCLPFSKYGEPDVKLKNSEDPNKAYSDFDFSNKEEIYFDSNDQSWLESDVEDFQSVTSDSTPTDSGTSPPLQESDVLTAGDSSLTDSKKQLIELFRDNITNDVDENEEMKKPTTNSTAIHQSSKSRETTPNRQPNQVKPKSPQTGCCLPNLVRSSSSSSSEKTSSSLSEKKRK